jgi:hypothetical protein
LERGWLVFVTMDVAVEIIELKLSLTFTENEMGAEKIGGKG